MIVCISMLGPLARLWVTGCDVDMGPLAMAIPKNGSEFAPAMGLGLMVLCGGMAQNDMGLNLNQRLCDLLMVCEVIKNRLDGASSMSQMVVVHLLVMRKCMRDQLC